MDRTPFRGYWIEQIWTPIVTHHQWPFNTVLRVNRFSKQAHPAPNVIGHSHWTTRCLNGAIAFNWVYGHNIFAQKGLNLEMTIIRSNSIAPKSPIHQRVAQILLYPYCWTPLLGNREKCIFHLMRHWLLVTIFSINDDDSSCFSCACGLLVDPGLKQVLVRDSPWKTE